MGTKKHKKQRSEHRYSENEEGGNLPPEKPLKLVLNLKGGIGSSQESQLEEASSPMSEGSRRHKHKKKKKKKSSDKDKERSYNYKHSEREHELEPEPHFKESHKRKREEDSEEDEYDTENTQSQAEELPPSYHEIDNERTSESEANPMDQEQMSPSRKLREPRSCTVKDSDGYVLRQMLNYLLKTLQNKDVNGFFAFPVTDSIAPGYSSIILHPMDFSTIAGKIEASEYINVMEFKKDFTQMCNNAMTYNRAETIFFREAKRLQQIGIRLLSKEKLLHLKKTHSYLATISLQELGFDETGQVIHIESKVLPAQLEAQKQEEQLKQEKEEEKADPERQEEIAAQEIVAQAQKAAEEAKNELVARKPNTDLGFLRLSDDGRTTMTILNPWNNGVVSSKQRVISLGDYMGKLKNGTGSLFKHTEDKRNKIDTETYLCYGPFSSHAPSYDSSFASCSKEESDLLLSTYGGEIGVQYAKSVQKFVDNSGYSAIEMVDKLLDTLTEGRHSKTILLQEQQKRKEEEHHQKALQDEMITKAQQAADEAEADRVQHNLNQTAALISELSQTQKERLSRDLPPHIGSVAPPTSKESELADQVSDSLVHLARQVNPQHVVSTGAVRNALGITGHPPLPPKPPTNIVVTQEQGVIAGSNAGVPMEISSDSDGALRGSMLAQGGGGEVKDTTNQQNYSTGDDSSDSESDSEDEKDEGSDEDDEDDDGSDEDGSEEEEGNNSY